MFSISYPIIIAIALSGGLASAQEGLLAKGSAVMTNLSDANWKHDADDLPGSESALLRQDDRTGAMELLARYPGKSAIPSHWHTSNERIIVLEGRMAIAAGDYVRHLDVGGYAFLPAKVIQKISCESSTRCTFYVYWDAKLDFHAVPAK